MKATKTNACTQKMFALIFLLPWITNIMGTKVGTMGQTNLVKLLLYPLSAMCGSSFHSVVNGSVLKRD